MAAAIKGYRMILIMPDNSSAERKAAMTAYGAELIPVTKEQGHGRRPRPALQMQAEGRGKVLDQFANGDNPEAHYSSTGPDLAADRWRITHFVSSMGTTGTIMGVSRYLKEQNPAVQIVGLQPMEGAAIPGIRRWPQEYLPKIYQAERVDRVVDMSQDEAEQTMRRTAREEGIFCGVSSGGAVAAALRLSQEVENAVIVAIICDRGDRYLSTGVYDAQLNGLLAGIPITQGPLMAKRSGALRFQPGGERKPQVPVGKKQRLSIERLAHDGRGIAFVEGAHGS